MSGSEAHRQGPQAAFGGSLESFAVVKEIPVEVKADVCLQALRKTLQHLRCMKKKASEECTQWKLEHTCAAFF